LREILGVDILFYGRISDYAGTSAVPVVNFSCQVLDTRGRKVVWSSISHARGDDWVFFFDWGKINSVHQLASVLVNAVIDGIFNTEAP
jgi:hypothetical protein